MREISFQRHFAANATGSALVAFGNTQVICTAMVEESIPPYRKDCGLGWLSAEYQMLPGSTLTRKRRKTDGRSTEIQRLIGRSLRACMDFEKLGERSIMIDCDVLAADGGTRTAAITGGFVALHDAVTKLLDDGLITESPLTSQIAAISVGIVDGALAVDLDYEKDVRAEVDMNVVGNDRGELIEVQGTGEQGVFNRQQLDEMLDGAQSAIAELVEAQKKALGI